MSIPRLAIQRPVTMFMLSGVIMLLGAISLTRLPVDLMPELQLPEHHRPRRLPRRRPARDGGARSPGRSSRRSAPSPASSRSTSTSSRRQQPRPPQLRLGHRPQRSRRRSPHAASTASAAACPRTPTRRSIFKFDSTAFPIMGLGVEGDFDPVTLREIAENDAVAAPRARRRRRRGQRQRRPAPADPRRAVAREDHRAQPVGRSHRQPAAHREPEHAARRGLRGRPRPTCCAARASSPTSTRSATSSCMTRDGVPVYLRDIAESATPTEDVRSVMRINGKPGVRMQHQQAVGQEHRRSRRAAFKREVERINREVPGVRLSVTQRPVASSSSARSTTCRSTRCSAAFLVILIIFAFLRDFRSTLIICTSIPISVIGTFALLYFGGYTLNTMTFGGLALGIGMIVDAAIVVLENTHRHLHMGKDRMTAAIDGSEEVWSAILASTLTHIAVFVPLLFLAGISSILFRQLSVVVMFSLAMSLFVAVTIVPVLCSRCADAAGAGRRSARASPAGCSPGASASSSGMDEGYRAHPAPRARPPADGHRASACCCSSPSIFVLLDARPTSCMPQTDEGEVTVDAELAVGTRIERTEAVLLRLEETDPQRACPRRARSSPQAAAAAASGGAGGTPPRHRSPCILVAARRARRASSDEIATDAAAPARRACPASSSAPARRAATSSCSASSAAATTRRLALEIRGHDLDDARRLAQRRQGCCMEHDAGHRRRPPRPRTKPGPSSRCASTATRRRMLGLTVTSVATTDPHQRRRHAGGPVPRARQRVPDHRPAARGGPRARSTTSATCCVSTPSGQVVPAKNADARRPRARARSQIERKNHGAHHPRQRRDSKSRSARPSTRCSARLAELRVPPDFSVGFGAEVEEQAKAVRAAAAGADPRGAARLRGDGVAVRVAARSVHHHVLDPAGGDRRRAGAAC